MNIKTTLWAISGTIIIVGGLLAYYVARKPTPAPATLEQPSTEASAYGTADPLEGKPDLNPVSKTNPFADIKTNPFE